MKKVLIAYYSRTGFTAKIAESIAEGIHACQAYGKTVGKKVAG